MDSIRPRVERGQSLSFIGLQNSDLADGGCGILPQKSSRGILPPSLGCLSSDLAESFYLGCQTPIWQKIKVASCRLSS
ncbi:MAG: hypothetical protein PHC50_01290 [Candidatus Cloacimonetes bacterium]|nr:hypothetical protein [Candidatus Cloacimonadota bacterium]